MDHPTPPVLDIVIPVYNEEVTLEACVRRLHAHLEDTFPYPFVISIADNASTDSTPIVADRLAGRLPQVRAVHLAQKGRGRALKQVWLDSDAPVLAYMDVDLSTDLDALWPLVAPLMSGHSDLAIGSRLHRSSRVVRGTKREITSRGYNMILHAALGAGFSDAQCGFKAIRADVAHELLPLVEDTTWFFDTELLIIAQRCRLRIHEVPVDWYDDPDSRVDVVGTAMDDLRGVWRMQRSFAAGRLPIEDIRRRMGRGAPAGVTGAQVIRFGMVGIASTLFHLGLFAVLAAMLAPQVANLIALLVATLLNTAVNRRWTFGVTGPGVISHQLQGLAIFGLTWALTAGALAGVHLAVASPPVVVQTVTVGSMTVIATVVKFLVMRSWRAGEEQSPEHQPLDHLSSEHQPLDHQSPEHQPAGRHRLTAATSEPEPSSASLV